MQPADGAFNTPIEAVSATILTKGLAPGRHLILVRGRGVNSYEGLQSWGPMSAAWLVIAPTGTPPELEGITNRPRGSRPGR